MEILRKDTVSNRPKLCGICAFLQNFHTMKFGEITIFYAVNLFQWFRNNHVKADADNCHLLVTGNCEASANINEFENKSSKKEKLLGISIDTSFSFEQHIICLSEYKNEL